MNQEIKPNSHNYDFSNDEIDEAYKKALNETKQLKIKITRIGFFWIGVPLALIWKHGIVYWPFS